MNLNLSLNEEEAIIKKRIILREMSIKNLTHKYVEFINKYNELARNNMIENIKGILNEIELLNISAIKTENILKLKDIDISYQNSIGNKIGKKI
jgi:hypothetical protein